MVENIPEEREFRTEKLTVAEAIAADISLSDFIDTRKAPVKLDWATLIKLCNAMMVKGKPLTDQSSVGEIIAVSSVVFKSAFL